MRGVPGEDRLPVADARAGDPAAWDCLFRRYQLPLYVYAVELIRDQQAALDVVQETFINASRHVGSLRDDAKFGSWLFGIAHQKCQQHFRRPARTEPFPDTAEEAFIASDESPAEQLIRLEQQEEFMTLVNDLTPEHRAVLLLHFLEEFSLDEISTVTGVTLGTVKSRLHYAKKALRALLAERTR